MGAIQETLDLEKTEYEIHRHLLVPNRQFLVESLVTKLKHIIDTSMQNVYKTPAERASALQQHVDDIRENVVLKLLSDAKTLAQKGSGECLTKACQAVEVAHADIMGLKSNKKYSWLYNATETIGKIYTQKAPGKAPKIVDLSRFGRKQDLDAICTLIIDEFTGETGYTYMESHAQLLYNYLKVFHKGGVALENAFCEMYEGLRETAVLRLVRNAANLANKRDRGFEANLQDAENAIYSNVKIDYRVPENKYTYYWFDKECVRIKSIYKNALRGNRKK